MWDLDHKEDWVAKNWCFWTVVLEKALEKSLGQQGGQPTHPKGDQPWVLTASVTEGASPERVGPAGPHHLHPLLGNRSCSVAAQVPQQTLPTGNHCQRATSVSRSAPGQGRNGPHPLVTVSEGALGKWPSQGSVVRWSSDGSEVRGRPRPPSPRGPPAYPASRW